MAQTLSATQQPQQHISTVSDYLLLMKPRVMSLAIFTAAIGMLVSPMPSHPGLLLISLVAIATGAGAAGVLNQWYDRDLDALMTRTHARPLPQGHIDPAEALSFGLILAVLSVMVLGLAANPLAGFMLAVTIFFYVVIYTIWLKRRTPHNIVIGGAAGAFPPVIGWLAAGGEASAVMPWLLFAIIFLWTPPHFWALALARRQDYKRANLPMLPTIASTRHSKSQIIAYSIMLLGATMLPTALGLASGYFALLAAILATGFMVALLRLAVADDTRLTQRALALFRYSISYLFLLFLGLGADAIILLGGTP